MKPDLIITKILHIIIPVLKKDLDQKNNFPVGFTFYHVLERVRFNLESIQILAKDNIVKHDHAIGLISRNLLSDFIATGYIIKLSVSEDDYYSKLYSLYDSDLRKVDSFLNMYKKAGFIDDDELKKHNKKYSDENHIYKVIRDYCEEFDLKSFPSTRAIIEKFLKSDMNDPWVDQVQKSYETWILLSKYEHLGWYSYDVTINTDNEKAIERLNSVLFKTVILVGSCLETLKEEQAMKDSVDLMRKFTQGLTKNKQH